MAERFAYTAFGVASEASLLPMLPVTISYQSRSTDNQGLLDTGASVNVLPYTVGVKFGAVWQPDAVSLRLSGNMARHDAQPLILIAKIGKFTPVRLAFAWTRSDEVPLIFGQTNFFMEFDVCFYRAQRAFEVQPRS